ncbi:MAG: helix-turn-helix transcriptional regulator [Pseudomonadota bacterium]
MSIRRDIGLLVRSLRLARDMKQERLAALIGVSQKTISLIENGRVATSIARLQEIAEALDVPLSWLFQFPEESDQTDDARMAKLSEVFAIAHNLSDENLNLLLSQARAIETHKS